MPANRTAAVARPWMTVSGVACPDVQQISGGGVSAPVIETPAGGGFTEKHVGPPAYEEFEVTVGLSSAPVLYEWIASAWTMSPQRRDGSVGSADLNGNATSERPFANALLTAVTIPKLGAASKDAAHLTLRFRPDFIPPRAASGKLPLSAKSAKKWLASNFRLELDGIDTTHVAAIESFTVTSLAAADVVGESRDVDVRPARPEFPNLLVSFPAASEQSWQTWFRDFVLDGNSGQAKEKAGAIVFLGPDLKAELGRISLHNVGICALRPPDAAVGSEKVARFTAELYCERMELHVGAPAPAPTPEPARVVPLPPRPRPVVPRG